MEENRKSARLVSRFHAPAAKQPNERLRAATGKNLLVLSRGLFENTLRVLSERSAGWRESAAIWVGRVVDDEWIVEAVHFHHELCDDRAGALSLELSEAAKFRLYAEIGKQNRRVIALIHTHPGEWVGLSDIDERNQIGSRIGFWSLVAPWYAREPWDIQSIGVHVRCEFGWARLDQDEIPQRVRIL